MYGRRTACAVYRKELQAILTVGLKPKGFNVEIGVKDPCTYRCKSSNVRLLHHIDDFRSTGEAAALKALFNTELIEWLDLKIGDLAWPGSVIQSLGRDKYRTKEIIATVPDSVHKDNILRLLGLDDGTAKPTSLPSKPRSVTEHQNPLVAPYDEIYRGATGSAIYYSLDRREIQFAVKELARRMSKPLDVDWLGTQACLLYTSDAADDLLCVDLGGRRIIKKKKIKITLDN